MFNSVLDLVTGCWHWLGTRHPKGYGTLAMRIKGRPRPAAHLAHRVAYEELVGQRIPEGMQIDHKCRNTSCINPDHLEVVTPEVNREREAEAMREDAEAQWAA